MSNVVPEGWEIGSFSDFATINPKLTSDVTLTPELKVSFIKMEDVSNDAQVKKMHVRNYVEVSKGFTKFNDHDVLVAKITPCFENGKGGYVEHLVNGIGFGSTEFHVLRAKKNTDSKYIYQYTNYDSFRLAAEASMCGTGGQRRVQTDFMKTHKVIFPPLPEQKKIAAILTSVDEVIEKTQAQIDKLKDLKTAMMQELLTCGVGVDGKPHTEFKDSPVGRIPKGWEVSKLIDLSINGIKNGTFNDPKKVGSGYKLINVVDMYRNLGVDLTLLKRLNIDEKEFSKNKVEYGDVFFTRSSLKLEGIAWCNINLTNDPELTFDGHLMCVRPNVEKIKPKYLAYYCLSDYARKFFMSAAKHSTMTTIGQADIAPLNVSLPSLSEQQHIIEIFDSILDKQELISAKLLALKNTKKALMQDLLTGKVRVKVD